MTEQTENQIQNQNLQVMDLFEIMIAIWKAKFFIIAFVILSIVIGIIYMKIITPTYISTITLYQVEKGKKSPLSAMAQTLGMSSGNDNSDYNIPDVVKSRTLSEKIVTHEWKVPGFDKKLTLLEYFDNKFKVKKPEIIDTKEKEERWNQRRIYGYSMLMAKKRLGISVDRETGLMTVSVEMENPELAKDIANFISLFVTNWVNDTQKESIIKNLEFINERTNILEKELQDAENEFKKFRETNRNILNSPDLQLELQRLQRQVTIKQEVYLTMVKQREVNQIEENKTEEIIKILDKAIESPAPFKPNKFRIVVTSFTLGMFLSCVLVISVYFLLKIGMITNKKLLNFLQNIKILPKEL